MTASKKAASDPASSKIKSYRPKETQKNSVQTQKKVQKRQRPNEARPKKCSREDRNQKLRAEQITRSHEDCNRSSQLQKSLREHRRFCAKIATEEMFARRSQSKKSLREDRNRKSHADLFLFFYLKIAIEDLDWKYP